jgi:hypothetical protein
MKGAYEEELRKLADWSSADGGEVVDSVGRAPSPFAFLGHHPFDGKGW